MTETPAAKTQFVILAPAGVPKSRMLNFREVQSSSRYEELLAKLQRFRGKVYCQDGAISPSELTPDGRHCLEIDEQSWHVFAVDRSSEEVCACVRYLPAHPGADFRDLWIRDAAISGSPTWGDYFRRAVEHERAKARGKGVQFAEVGGWAVAEARRCTTEPIRMILGVWGLSRILGGCVGVATATVRHGSAVILRRIGLSSLVINGVTLPSYYDPHYGCEMEALRFDSDLPNPKYRNWIEELRRHLEAAPVICKGSRAANRIAPVRVLQPPQLPVAYPVSIAG